MKHFPSIIVGLLLVGAGPKLGHAAEEGTKSSTTSLGDEDLRYFDDRREAPEGGKREGVPRSIPQLDPRLMDRVSIFGEDADSPRIAGSAHVVDDETLQRYERNDIHKILSQVPGVYVRGEEGYGLRPNISLRGVDPNRSSKIVLLEDNILLGPAPYSAPAAYYFPLVTRMTGVEVFKGPAAIVTGPNTIGGAINFLTQPIPESAVAFVDLAGGSDSFAKIHGYAGTGAENWGLLVEGAHVRTDGFKELATEAFDFADDAGTGFDRNDVMVKARINTDLDAPVFQKLQLKLGWGSEVSNETYLGLSEADFDRGAALRYPASQLDRMTWDRLQAELTHEVSQERWRLRTTFYRHDFWRIWRRLDGFGPPFSSGANLNEILRRPGNDAQRAILSGTANTTAPNQTLLVTFNDRSYVSQGIQSELTARFATGVLQHDVRAGARLHHDRIERDHDSEEFAMTGGRMVRTDTARFDTTANRDSALAGAFFVQDQIRLGRLTVAPAGRVEIIHIERAVLPDNPGQLPDRSQTNVVGLPGLGASYGLTDRLFLLAGVHRGFSPATPPSARPVNAEDDAETVPPEFSWNVESGLRWAGEKLRAEAIGFANIYENFVVNCTASAGCTTAQLDVQQDLGRVNTFGVETELWGETALPWGLTGSLGVVYTFTRSTIQNEISGGVIPTFNGAEAGDRFPFLPLHVGSLTGGLGNEDFDVSLTIRGQSRTYDAPEGAVPDEGELRDAFFTDAYAVLDASARYRPTSWLELYATGINLTDARYVVGRRPFGPRPGQTLTVFGGLKLRYGQ